MLPTIILFIAIEIVVLTTSTIKVPVLMDERIVGGTEVDISRFPHQVSLQLQSSHICGAAILTNRIVLTAAHCVLQYNQPELYSIRAGSSEYSRGGVVSKAKHILPHELYNKPTSLNNDIALVQLQNVLPFSRNIQPIELMRPEETVLPQAKLFISGWGAMSIDADGMSPKLRYTFVKTRDQRICNSAYVGAGTVTATMFCAGAENGGRDSCQGDSGGPLVTSIRGEIKLYGVVSWGVGCAHPDFPGVYTKVPSYTDWVRQSIKQM